MIAAKQKEIDAVKNLFLEAQSFLLVSHRNPDGDAIGSSLALASGLISLRKYCEIVNVSNVPSNLNWMSMAEQIRLHPTEEKLFDVIVYLDCANKERCGFSEDLSLRASRVVNIDHHPGNSRFGSVNLIDEGASAVGELVYYVLLSMKVNIDFHAATAIYTAILTDTGSFRFSNANPKTFMIAAELARLGVDTSWVSQMVYDQQPAYRLRLLSLVLNTLDVSADNKAASILVTQAMMKETGAKVEDVDGFVNYPRSINGIFVGLLFREEGSNQYRIAFRSKGVVDVAKIAESYGGGGHRNAAGATVFGEYDLIKHNIFNKVEQAIIDAECEQRAAG